MIPRERIVECARRLIGTPFRHQARLPGVGIDCLNLIGETGLQAGVPNAAEWLADPVLHQYGPTARPDILMAKCRQYLDPVPKQRIGLGDILLFAFVFTPQHFAIVSRVRPTYIIHATPTTGVGRVVESGAEIAKAKLLAAWRFRGVAA